LKASSVVKQGEDFAKKNRLIIS